MLSSERPDGLEGEALFLWAISNYKQRQGWIPSAMQIGIDLGWSRTANRAGQAMRWLESVGYITAERTNGRIVAASVAITKDGHEWLKTQLDSAQHFSTN